MPLRSRSILSSAKQNQLNESFNYLDEMMSELFFTDDHEWVRIDQDTITVGITDHAQSLLGEVVFIEFPELGSHCSVGDGVAVIESVKAASDVYAPVTGEVVAVNEVLETSLDLINDDPEGEAWFFKVRADLPIDTSAWMGRDSYLSFINAEN